MEECFIHNYIPEKQMLWKIFGGKKEKSNRKCGKVHNEEFQNLSSQLKEDGNKIPYMLLLHLCPCTSNGWPATSVCNFNDLRSSEISCVQSKFSLLWKTLISVDVNKAKIIFQGSPIPCLFYNSSKMSTGYKGLHIISVLKSNAIPNTIQSLNVEVKTKLQINILCLVSSFLPSSQFETH